MLALKNLSARLLPAPPLTVAPVTPSLTPAELAAQRQHAQALPIRPLLSVLVPVYNPPPEVLDLLIASVVQQTYAQWELILADGGSTRAGVKATLERWAHREPRVRVLALPENRGIAHNSNAALAAAQGEFVVLADHDDELAPQALYAFAQYFNHTPAADMVYSDEDRVDLLGHCHTPFHKPDWSPELLGCFMYVGHLTAYRRTLVQAVGGFRSEFDFSQDYDLTLRIVEQTPRIGHIPEILYHWRELPGSGAAGDKPYARVTNLAALAAAVQRRGWSATVQEYPSANRIKFAQPTPPPLISIIIPTDRAANVLPGLAALLSTTAYPAFEILPVCNSPLAAEITAQYGAEPRVRPVPFDAPFNFSAKCNLGVQAARGTYVLFLNDDVQPLEPEWLDCLLEQFQQPGVGAVAPKMMYANGLVQHAGLVTGVRGWVGTAFHCAPVNDGRYFNLLLSVRTASAISAACLLMPTAVFHEIGGYDAINTPIMHSDLDLCFKIRDLGLRLVYTPFTTLKHVGHASLGEVEAREGRKHSPKADLYLLKRWAGYTAYDPYYPPRMRDLLYWESPAPYQMFGRNQNAPPTSKADVLCVNYDLTFSGAPVITQALAAHWQQTGYFVTIAAPEDGPLRVALVAQGFPVVVDSLLLSAPEKLESLFRDFDIVVVHTLVAWRVVLAAKAFGKRVLWFVHEGQMHLDGLQAWLQDQQFQEALAAAEVVVFPSHSTQLLYRAYQRHNQHRTIYYGIRLPQPEPITLPPNPAGRLRVALVGSVEPRKGQDVLVAALRQLSPAARDRFEFYMVGRFLLADYVEQLRQETAAWPNVHWVGSVTQAVAQGYMAACDIFLCTSRDETGPLVVLEAMALKRMVITTTVGAMPERLQPDRVAWLVPPGDPAALAAALQRLLTAPESWASLGAAAQAQFNAEMTMERYGYEVTEVLEEILATPSLAYTTPLVHGLDRPQLLARIQQLEQELSALRAAPSYQWVLGLQQARLRLAPPHSGREQLLDALLLAWRAGRQRGLRAAWQQAWPVFKLQGGLALQRVWPKTGGDR